MPPFSGTSQEKRSKVQARTGNSHQRGKDDPRKRTGKLQNLREPKREGPPPPPPLQKSETRGQRSQNQRDENLWHRPDEDISQAVETPEEEKMRLKLQKLEARRRERSGHEDGQDKIEKTKEKTLRISPFKAINESNGENEGEETVKAISPIYVYGNPSGTL